MRLSETQGRKSDQGPKGLRRGGGKEVNFWSLGNRMVLSPLHRPELDLHSPGS